MTVPLVFAKYWSSDVNSCCTLRSSCHLFRSKCKARHPWGRGWTYIGWFSYQRNEHVFRPNALRNSCTVQGNWKDRAIKQWWLDIPWVEGSMIILWAELKSGMENLGGCRTKCPWCRQRAFISFTCSSSSWRWSMFATAAWQWSWPGSRFVSIVYCHAYLLSPQSIASFLSPILRCPSYFPSFVPRQTPWYVWTIHFTEWTKLCVKPASSRVGTVPARSLNPSFISAVTVHLILRQPVPTSLMESCLQEWNPTCVVMSCR